MNVLKPQQKIDLEALLKADFGYREIERRLGIRRETASKYADILGIKSGKPASTEGVATGFEVKTGQNAPPRPPGGAESKKIPKHAESACAPHREWIEKQVLLGRNAQSIYQDLVEQFAFTHKYNSVKRFVRGLKAREPERFDVLEFLPGEEAQVDYGQGALTEYKLEKFKRPYLFVMTLKYSGKSFRKVVWKTSQEIWSKLHEEAFRSFGGCPQYIVLDNLKEGVIKPDIYEPVLNPVYAAMLAHYGVVAQPCRVADPNRKGTVERAIQHTQDTALKGRKFNEIEKQNEWLAHWEEHWAALRIHGRKKRQVMEMYLEEKPHLLKLPAEGFRYFKEEARTVDDAGLVQVKGSYYPAMPAALYSEVKVRIYDDEIVILDKDGLILRRHERSLSKGKNLLKTEDRIFNPSRETTKLLERIERIGPSAAELARGIFTRDGRAGHGVIYGLSNLTRDYRKEDIETACAKVIGRGVVSYHAVKRILERGPKRGDSKPDLKQSGSEIRPVRDYQTFWEMNSQTNKEEDKDGDVYH
jgi:transposase